MCTKVIISCQQQDAADSKVKKNQDYSQKDAYIKNEKTEQPFI